MADIKEKTYYERVMAYAGLGLIVLRKGSSP